MKTFTEDQMCDPWAWCLRVVEKHQLDSKLVAEVVGKPRSTIRGLFNGSSTSPRYDILSAVLRLCVDIETCGWEESVKQRDLNSLRKPENQVLEEVASEQLSEPKGYDFL